VAVVGKLLSWFFFRIKRLEGKLTRVLEVTFENGKKVLNLGGQLFLRGTSCYFLLLIYDFSIIFM